MLAENYHADEYRCEETHHRPYCSNDGKLILLQNGGKTRGRADGVDKNNQGDVGKTRCQRDFLGRVLAEREKECGEYEPRDIRKKEEKIHTGGLCGTMLELYFLAALTLDPV